MRTTVTFWTCGCGRYNRTQPRDALVCVGCGKAARFGKATPAGQAALAWGSDPARDGDGEGIACSLDAARNRKDEAAGE